MARRFEGTTLVVATHNPGKLPEIAALVSPLGVTPISAGSLELPEPEETGLTFRENAELKALAAAKASDLPSLADDSGLSVTALGGDPGIYSARWAGPSKNFAAAIAKVEAALAATGSSDRSAAFICALALAWPDGHVECFEGRIEGTLIFPPRGTDGFGYDPIFMADGMTRTFGEIEPKEKHAISHRARAFAQLLKACFADA